MLPQLGAWPLAPEGGDNLIRPISLNRAPFLSYASPRNEG